MGRKLKQQIRVALGTGTGSPIIMGTHGEFWRSVILLPCSTRFLEILEVIEQLCKKFGHVTS
jgi:hypothetical protein